MNILQGFLDDFIDYLGSEPKPLYRLFGKYNNDLAEKWLGLR